MKVLSSLALILVVLPLTVAAQGSVARRPLHPVFKQGHWGYADAAGKLVIEPRFDAAAPFVDGLAQVGMVDETLREVDGAPNLQWGFIDDRGAVVVPLQYAAVRPFSGDRAAVAVRIADPKLSVFRSRNGGDLRWGYVDRKGAVAIPLEFLAAADFTEGLAAVNVIPDPGDRASEGTLCEGPRNFGYIDVTGAFIIAPQFESAGVFVNGQAQVCKGEVRYIGRCLCCAPRFYGVIGNIDRTGKFTQITQTDSALVQDGLEFP